MKSTEEDLTQGSHWLHYSGRTYTIILLANLESTNPRYPVTVVYQGENGNIWSRPASDWNRSMTKMPETTCTDQ